VAFTLPTFNLLCDIYTGPWIGKALRLTGIQCNLALGRRVATPSDLPNNSPIQQTPVLLLPPSTDVRDGSCASGFDVVEVPRLSGRWYAVQVADDIGKGFPNEHRYAVLVKACQRNDSVLFPGLFWPTPIP